MDALQHFLRWFVGGVFGNEFAGEGAGEKGGRLFVHMQARLLKPRLDLAGQRKQPFHSAHDFPSCSQKRSAAHNFPSFRDLMPAMNRSVCRLSMTVLTFIPRRRQLKSHL